MMARFQNYQNGQLVCGKTCKIIQNQYEVTDTKLLCHQWNLACFCRTCMKDFSRNSNFGSEKAMLQHNIPT